jgi:hypothetical protein
VRSLREAWGKLDARQRSEEAAATAAAKRKRDVAAAAERERHLSDLAGRITSAWKDVDLFIGQRNQHSYDQAVNLLVDLKAVAGRAGGDPASFQRQLAKRLADNSRRPNFIAAAKRAGLVT